MSIRFSVDYRSLNKVATKDMHPMPRIDDALDSLQLTLYYPSLASRLLLIMANIKGALITPDGLSEFNVVLFELSN